MITSDWIVKEQKIWKNLSSVVVPDLSHFSIHLTSRGLQLNSCLLPFHHHPHQLLFLLTIDWKKRREKKTRSEKNRDIIWFLHLYLFFVQLWLFYSDRIIIITRVLVIKMMMLMLLEKMSQTRNITVILLIVIVKGYYPNHEKEREKPFWSSSLLVFLNSFFSLSLFLFLLINIGD